MIASDYSLELCNVFHTGQVEPGTCMQRLLGSVQTGLILKDVSLEVHGGEVLAVLGSKGSGKRALLDVVARRARGPTRGQVLLNGAPMTPRLFQQACGYVTPRCDLLPGLSTEQTLYYAAQLALGPRVSRSLKRSRVRQVLADLALSQAAQRPAERLTQSEYRRLAIGVQLVRDPVLLLLDEPTWDLDPLNTYLVVSILSNHARKYGRAVLLTMEKPRSDVFPFLDRVAYLCLGEVVYTGGTRLMLDYFRAIGFPCPELENPLMYYLCLSTVDRRSRERFIESNHQIAALVEKFKLEGGPFRKSSAGAGAAGPLGPLGPLPGRPLEPPDPLHAGGALASNKVPLSAFGRPGVLHALLTLVLRQCACAFSVRRTGLAQLGLRLLAHPLFCGLLYLLYSGMQDYQRTFLTRNGLIFNCMAGAYFLSVLTTVCIFPALRTRYYQEAQEGLYGGPAFLIGYLLVSLPLSLLSMAAASRISFELTGLSEAGDWLRWGAVLWACHLLAEQQTLALLLAVRSSLAAALASIYVTVVAVALGSGTLRSVRGLPEWLVYLTYGTQPRYAGAALAHQLFHGRLAGLPRDELRNCSFPEGPGGAGPALQPFACRYADGSAFLAERWGREGGDDELRDMLDYVVNLGVAFAFPAAAALLNCLLYLAPLPAAVKAKFRE